MNLKPVIVHVAALPFMYKADLPRTEILLTTLARSLVWQDGFNVTQGGGKPDDDTITCGNEEKKNVCHARDFLKKNLSATLQRMKEVRNKIEIIKNLSKIDLDSLETEINRFKERENELEMKVMELESSLADDGFMDKYKELKEIEERQDEALA